MQFDATTGESLALAAQAGRATADYVTRSQSLVDLQERVAGPFVLTENSLSLAEGKVPTVEDFGSVIGGFLQAGEGFRAASQLCNWGVGDACLLAEQVLGEHDAEQLITQICNDWGRERHTVQESIRCCKAFPKHERVKGASFSMHSELRSYSKRFTLISKEKGLEMLREAAANERMRSAEFRDALRAAGGKPPSEGNGSAPVTEETEDAALLTEIREALKPLYETMAEIQGITGHYRDALENTLLDDIATNSLEFLDRFRAQLAPQPTA